MKFRNKIFAAWIGFALMSVASSVGAAEHWDLVQSPAVPWDSVRSMTVFQNQLYVSGTKIAQRTYLWKTSDHTIWNAVATPLDGTATNAADFATFQGSLYMFVVSSAPAPRSGILSILKSNDGQAWTFVNGGFGTFGFGTWTDVHIFKNKMYAADNTGRLQETSDGSSWSVVTNFPSSGANEKIIVSLAEYNNALYAARVTDDFFDTTSRVSRTTDGTKWTAQTSPPAGETLRPGATAYGESMYWSGLFLEKGDSTGSNVAWSQTVVGNSPLPFILNNQLHAVALPSQVFTLSTEGDWEIAFQENSNTCASATARYHRAVTFGESTYVAPCSLMRFRQGAYSAAINSTNQNIVPGQTAVQVASVQLEINAQDRLTALTIVNVGTARATTEILQVAVYRSNNGAVGAHLGDLTAQPDGMTWTSTSLAADVTDGDEVLILADVAADAQSGTTFRARLPIGGLAFATNETYTQTTALTTSGIQTIGTAAIDPVTTATGLTAFPSPARDSAHFLYPLSAESDIEIDFYDRGGSQVLSFKESQKAANPRAVSIVNCAELPSGIYYVTVKIKGPTTSLMKTKLAIEK